LSVLGRLLFSSISAQRVQLVGVAVVLTVVSGAPVGGPVATPAGQTPTAEVSDGHPAWSPVDGRIAFDRTVDGAPRIHVIDLATGRVTPLTSGRYPTHHPAWAPDGSWVAFASERRGNTDLYAISANGIAERRLTRDAAVDATPAWSPDGSRIAFSSRRDGALAVYILDLESLDIVRISPPVTAPATRPAWAPDGRRIVFQGGEGADRRLYVADTEDRTALPLTRSGGTDTVPDWSPDGARIAFSSRRDGGRRELYLLEVEGRRATRVTDDPADDADPSWSPDGSRLVFYSDRRGGYELFILEIDTGSVSPALEPPPGLDGTRSPGDLRPPRPFPGMGHEKVTPGPPPGGRGS